MKFLPPLLAASLFLSAAAAVALFFEPETTPPLGQGISQLSPFFTSVGQVRLASTTADFRVPSLASEDCIGTDATGVFQSGSCSELQNLLASSSPWTAGQLTYIVDNTTLRGVATTTLTASAPLSVSNAIAIIGSAPSALTLDTSGTWSGNAGTATALAANGANCASGSAPLGIDASGAVESCFDVWTEAENTAAAYISDLSSFDTGDLVEGSNLYFTDARVGSYLTASSTLGNFLATLCSTITGGAGLCDGTDADTTYTAGDHVTLNGTDFDVDDDFLLNTGDVGTGTYDFGGATIKQHLYPAWTWPGVATTTTATTTVPLAFAGVSELWNTSRCKVTASTGGYRYGDGTNFMEYVPASTTPGTYTLSTNNTFIAEEDRVVEVGPLTGAQITCTLDKTVNPQ